jgi:leucyl aminopeptidase (aminopeptidase T)
LHSLLYGIEGGLVKAPIADTKTNVQKTYLWCIELYERIVKRIVEESLCINEDDSVVINARGHTMNFVNARVVEIRKTGADVLITTTNDELILRTMTELPETILRKPSKLAISMLDFQTVNILIYGLEDPTIPERIPKEKYGAGMESILAYHEKIIEKKIRSFEIVFGIVTPQRAKIYGLDYDSWMEMTTKSLDVSFTELRKIGTKVAEKLEKANEVHVTAPGGTDFKFKVSSRTVYILDGIIDPESIRRGKHFEELPTGCVALAPHETSASGKVVANLPHDFSRTWVKEPEWSFENGSLKKWSAKENLEIWNKYYTGGTGNKYRLGTFVIGLNPNAQTGFLRDLIVKGVVSIGIGFNKYLGGVNDDFAADMISISDATVKLDGEPILEKGEFRI